MVLEESSSKRQKVENRSPALVKADEAIASNAFDVDAWHAIIVEAHSRPIDQARDLWERVLARFPTAARCWRAYAEAELQANNFDRCETIFNRCLLKIPDVELFQTYLMWIVRVKQYADDARAAIEAAFEFALKHVGQDINSGQVWSDFIEFHKSKEASSQLEVSQRMTAVRKAYQRAVVVPMSAIDRLWKDYDVFEHQLSKELAAGLLAELQPKFIAAKLLYNERARRREKIGGRVTGTAAALATGNANAVVGPTVGAVNWGLARPPSGQPEVAARDYQQVLAWQDCIRYEKTNPSKLSKTMEVKDRVMSVYRQALMSLRHYPEMWHEAAQYLYDLGAVDEASALMTEATAAMPSNPLIHFLAADLEESRQCFDKARAYYERLVSNAPSPLAFIQFQRFVRRCEGIEAARKVFLAARQSSQCSHQVYSAAALLELHLNKEPKVAANVFSLGHKLYGTNIDFVCTYLDFLLHQNDAANFRVVAEKALEQLHVPSTSSTANSTQADQAESARLAAATRVWQRIADFEALSGGSSAGDARTAAERMAKRRRDAFKAADTSAFMDVVERFHYADLWPCSFEHRAAVVRNLGKNHPSALGLLTESSSPVGVSTMSSSMSDDQRRSLPRPDLSRLELYHPSTVDVGAANVSSSVVLLPPFPIPEAVTALLKKLPPALALQGLPPLNAEVHIKLLASFDVNAPLTAELSQAGLAMLQSFHSQYTARPPKARGEDDDDDDDDDDAEERDPRRGRSTRGRGRSSRFSQS